MGWVGFVGLLFTVIFVSNPTTVKRLCCCCDKTIPRNENKCIVGPRSLGTLFTTSFLRYCAKQLCGDTGPACVSTYNGTVVVPSVIQIRIAMIEIKIPAT